MAFAPKKQKNMIENLIGPGTRVEITEVKRSLKDAPEKHYMSQVYDIPSDEKIEITMPMEQQKLILLPQGGRVSLTFYANNTLYQAMATVRDRYRDGNIYLLSLELTSNLTRFQRREYYRFSCTLQLSSRMLDEEEIKELDLDETADIPASPSEPLESSVIMDISGGGIRFIGKYCYQPGSKILCIYHLSTKEEAKEYHIVSEVLEAREKEGHPGLYEHRAKYIDISDKDREEIIRFIFEEERRHRQSAD